MVLVGQAAIAGDTSSRVTLTGDQIRTALVGKSLSDGAHWTYDLNSDGAIAAVEMGRSRRGHWEVLGNKLCIRIVAGAAPDECWEVVRAGRAVLFRTGEQDIYEVAVKRPANAGK